MTTDGERLGFVDARRGVSDVDPALRVAGVPLVLWAVRALRLVLPAGSVAVACEGGVAGVVDRAGVRVLDDAGAEGLFLERMEAGRGAPELVARVGMPFCSRETAALALAASGSDLASFQVSAVERVRVTGSGDLEVVEAVARGLAPDHAAVVGASRFRLPGRAVRAIVADVDGTLTDGSVFMSGDAPGGDSGRGEPGRRFDTRDGMAVGLLREAGIPLAILSSTLRGVSSEQRMRMLGVPLEHLDVGPGHKGQRFLDLCGALGVGPEETLYVGDDVNDGPAMELAGVVACPADAHPAVRNAADLVLESIGGRGVLRELADMLIGGLVLEGAGAGG